MALIEYEYIGPAQFFVDKHAGSGEVWIGKGEDKRALTGSLDDLRAMGNIKGIDAAFAPRFDEIYVNCVGAQMKLVTPPEKAKATKADKTKIPAGTPYSGYTYAQLSVIYAEKTGKSVGKDTTGAQMVEEIQAADAASQLQPGGFDGGF